MGAKSYLDLILEDYRITALVFGSFWLVISFALYLIKVKLEEQKENQAEQEPAAAPLAPYRALMATTETPEAASAGLALSRWRGQLANSTGWNQGTSTVAVPQEPALPCRDLPNPEVDTRAIRRATETSRPLLVGPAEEVEKKVATEIRDRLGKLQSLHAART